MPQAANMTFVLKEREPEVRENATKEFYANFSASKLKGLLAQLDAEEAKALEEIQTKYTKQRSTYTAALERARAVRGNSGSK